MSREKIFNLKAMGARGGADPLRRRQGPSRLLPGHGRAHRARNAGRVLHQPVRQPRQPGRARVRHRPGNPARRWRVGGLDAIVFGCGSSGTMTGLSRCFARAVAAHRTGARRSGRLDPRGIHQPRHAQRQVGELDGRGHRRGFPAADLRLHPGQEGLRDQRQGKLPHRARAAGEGRHPRRLLHRHAAGRGAEVLPRADHAEEGAGVRLRHRQQVPVEDVQRLLDARQRLPRARAARRPARPDPAPVLAARHRRGRRRPTCWSPPTSA